jgi:hypothetical protein
MGRCLALVVLVAGAGTAWMYRRWAAAAGAADSAAGQRIGHVHLLDLLLAPAIADAFASPLGFKVSPSRSLSLSLGTALYADQLCLE